MQVSAQTYTLRLSELSRRIADTVSSSFANLQFWVIAEVSNHSYYAHKEHHYFELIEKEDNGILAKMQAVAWRSGALKIKNFEVVTGQKFRNGLKICLRVQVEYHSAYGLKLLVSDVDPSFTLGQLELQRQATLERLLSDCASFISKTSDGFLTRNNQLLHAPVIQRIAILSSRASAGYEDFIHTLANNQFQYSFYLHNYFIAVQGEGNAEKICEKLDEIRESTIEFDAVVIIRGGGADTDFILFDQYNLCRSVASLHIPVITGIGHLKNQSIVDLLAHTSTNAPTRAAEFIVAHNRRFESQLLDHQRSVVLKSRQILQRHEQLVERNNAVMARHAKAVLATFSQQQQVLKERVTNSARQQVYRQQNLLRELTVRVSFKPLHFLAYRKMELKNSVEQFAQTPLKFLLTRERELEYQDSFCRMMSPVNILKKGFALVYRDEKIITSGSSISEGDKLLVKLQDSELNIIVKNKTMNHGEETYL